CAGDRISLRRVVDACHSYRNLRQTDSVRYRRTADDTCVVRIELGRWSSNMHRSADRGVSYPGIERNSSSELYWNFRCFLDDHRSGHGMLGRDQDQLSAIIADSKCSQWHLP